MLRVVRRQARRLLPLLALLVAPASASWAQQTARDSAVLAADERWLTAYDRRDSAAIRRVFDPDARMIHASGRVSGTEDEVRAVMQPGPPELDARWRVSDRRVRLHGTTAVVWGRYTNAGRYRGEAFEHPYHYTAVYAARGRAWRLVHVHFSRIGGAPRGT